MFIENRHIQICRRACIAITALLFIACGVSIIVVIFLHLSNSEELCQSPPQNILRDHPELYLWEFCEIKVYSFFLLTKEFRIQ